MKFLLKITFLFSLLLTFSTLVFSQEDSVDSIESENSALPEGEKPFPIAVVDMQYIVAKCAAAVKVREYLENMKSKFGIELKAQEDTLKKMQEELGSQRSILPPDEFSVMENDFRKKVEQLQKTVADKNQLLENLLSQSIKIIQTEAIKIITNIGRERGLALAVDTSTVVIAADSINISQIVIERLNTNLKEVDMSKIMESLN